MTRTQKIIGASATSLLLLSITLFSMCGIRMQRFNGEDDVTMASGSDEASQDDIFDQLEFMDDNSQQNNTDGSLFSDMSQPAGNSEMANAGNSGEFRDTNEFGDNFSLNFDAPLSDRPANGFAMSSAGTTAPPEQAAPAPDADATAAEQNFLKPELVQGLESEVQDLENVYAMKQKTADSLLYASQQAEFKNVAEQGVKQTRELADKPLLASTAPDLPPAAPVSTRTRNRTGEIDLYYQDALDEFYARRYTRAITKFRDMLLRGDAKDLADNCQYWIGESYYALGDYLNAVVEFEKVYAYSNSNKLSDAQLMVGLALMKRGDTQQAKTELSSLVNFNGKAAAAQKARRYLEQLQRA